LDETLFCRAGPWRTQQWDTSIVHVTPGITPDRSPNPQTRSASISDIGDAGLVGEFVDRLGVDLQDDTCPPEVRSLGRTILRWREQIVAWHHAFVSNGPTEAVNNLIKRIKRIGFGFRRFVHYRSRVLLYAGKPYWNLLPDLTPRWDGSSRWGGEGRVAEHPPRGAGAPRSSQLFEGGNDEEPLRERR
jgi:hypothetical protein